MALCFTTLELWPSVRDLKYTKQGSFDYIDNERYLPQIEQNKIHCQDCVFNSKPFDQSYESDLHSLGFILFEPYSYGVNKYHYYLL